jgi:HSP20 family protein
MSIIRYNTGVNNFTPTTFSTLIDRFFNESLSRAGGSQYSFVPKVDIIERDKSFEIQFAVPGMKKEDFKIDLNENILTVSGERKFSGEKKGNDYVFIETQYGAFSRSFTLPDNVDSGKIAAAYVNGILEVTVPKDEKKAVKTTIKVD